MIHDSWNPLPMKKKKKKDSSPLVQAPQFRFPSSEAKKHSLAQHSDTRERKHTACEDDTPAGTHNSSALTNVRGNVSPRF